MAKNLFSYFLLICAAWVAYVYISDYLDGVMVDNFTTPSVTEMNRNAQKIWVSADEYKIGVQETE